MSAERPINRWPIRGYWISFNPETHKGGVALQVDNDAEPDVKFENLSADDIAALAAILTQGGSEYIQFRSGVAIGIKR